MLTRLACERHLADLDRAGTAEFPYVFDERAARRACLFAELMPHIKGEWARAREDGTQSTIRLEPWQVFFLASVFGWLHGESGYRRFRTAYLEVPRKNAKSTLGAVIVLYMLALDGEPGAGVYSAATTRDQARIVFDDAREMARRSPDLLQRYGIVVERYQILQPGTASIAKPITREQSANEGLHVHLGLNDELHAHKTADVYEVLDQGRGARRNSLLLSITTAGADLGSICFEVRTMIVGILQGMLGSPELDRVFGLIYTIDDDDDPHDATTWRKANPNFGVSVYEDEFSNAHAQAAAAPARWSEFLTKRLNVWVRSGSPWFDLEAWRTRCTDSVLSRRARRVRSIVAAGRQPRASDIPGWFDGRRCFIGIDLATRRDLAAMVAVFPVDGLYYAFGRYYLPSAAIADARTAAYSGWAKTGAITVTEGETTDFEFIERDLLEWHRRFEVGEVPYDPREARQFATGMLNEHGVPMVEFRQGYSTFNEPMKEADSLVVRAAIRHNGDPVLAWAMSNVTGKVGAYEDVMPAKDAPQSKIDPAVAFLMALARALMFSPEPQSESVYEERGVRRL
ncbi:MAG: terminase TerL endonuclease subunit [Dehalococcoidia bacterium]